MLGLSRILPPPDPQPTAHGAQLWRLTGAAILVLALVLMSLLGTPRQAKGQDLSQSRARAAAAIAEAESDWTAYKVAVEEARSKRLPLMIFVNMAGRGDDIRYTFAGKVVQLDMKRQWATEDPELLGPRVVVSTGEKDFYIRESNLSDRGVEKMRVALGMEQAASAPTYIPPQPTYIPQPVYYPPSYLPPDCPPGV